MNVRVTIMAHKDSQATFDRHAPYWADHGWPVAVTCPIDSPVKTDFAKFPIGHRCHHGPEAIRRFREILMWIWKVGADWNLIYEYDSLCLTPKVPEECFRLRGLWANVFPNNDHKFRGSFYTHPPLLVDHGTLTDIVKHPLPDTFERGFWDRWLGLVCERAKIPVHHYENLGFSRNTIESCHLVNGVAAVIEGAVMIHGIKTDEALRVLSDARYQNFVPE